MIPILFPTDAVSFTSNGYGRLNDIISCTATEEKNGVFETEFEFPLTGVHYSDIKEGRIVLCTHDDTRKAQPFDIYRKSAPMNGIVTFNARHVAYRLRNIIVKPFEAHSLADTLLAFQREIMTDNPFTFWTDIDKQGDFILKHPASIWELMGDSEGSILNVFGPGEWEFDGWTVKLHAHRGVDSGVTIRYGKNLTDIEHTVDGDDVYNAIIPYWQDKEETIVGDVIGTPNAPLKLIDWSTDQDVEVTDENNKRIEFALAEFTVRPMDFSQTIKDRPTVEELDEAAGEYLNSHSPWLPKENIRVDFIALWQTTEYADFSALQRVRLCDTVTVMYPALGVEATSEVIRTVYNVLSDRYDQIEVGEARVAYGDLILAEATHYTKEETQTALEDERDYMTKLIRGGFGGHVVTVTDANGRPTETLYMDTDDVNTAVNVLRINKNGIGFSSHGPEGPFESAWTLDGRFVADWISTGVLNANLIKAGTLDGQYINCINLHAVDASVSGQFKAELDDSNYIQIDSGEMNLIADGHRSVRVQHNIQSGEVVGGAIQLYDPNDVRRAALFTDSTSDVVSLRFYNENGYRTLQIQNNGMWFVDPVSGHTVAHMYYSSDNSAWWKMIDPQDTSDYSIWGPFGIWFYQNDNIVATITAQNGIYTAGDLIVGGTKNRAIDTKDGKRLLYAVESAEPYFTDIGEGQIGEDGEAVIKIDSIFKQTVDLEGYQVFCQKYGPGDLWAEKQKTQFKVHGTPGLKFAWEIKAHQLDHNGKRLEKYEVKLP